MEKVFDLRHGVQLKITGDLGKRGINVLADFLMEAMRHFKQLRDIAKLPVNGDSYRRGYRSGPRMQVSFDVFHPTPLPTALWVDAVISAYTNANTLEQIIDEFKAYRASSMKGDKSMDDLLGLLEKKDILGAFEMSLKDSVKFSQENGLYEPGVPYAESYAKVKEKR